MRILTSLVVSLFLTYKSAAETDVSWDARIFGYFHAKAVRSVDVRLCSSADGLKLFELHKNLVDQTDKTIPSLLRIVKTFEIENIDLDRRTGLFIDVSCDKKQQMLLELADDRLFTNTFSWLIWHTKMFSNESYIDLPISTFSDVSVASGERIVKLYRHRAGLPLIIQDVGMWNPEAQEYFMRPWSMRIDLQKTIINGGIMIIEDIYDRKLFKQHFQDDQYKPGNDVTNRFNHGCLLLLVSLYNFKLQIIETTSWGERYSNGTWTGLLGLLQRQEVDVSVSPLIPIPIRMETSFPSVPLLPYCMPVVFKQPRSLGTYKAMILELSVTTWVCVAVVIIVGGFVFAVTQSYGQSRHTLHDSDLSISMGLVQSVGILSNQGLSLEPSGNPRRIVSLSLLVVGLLISNYYSAATMTALLSPSPPVIKSLEELMSSEIPLAAMDATYVRILKTRPIVFRKIIVDRMSQGLEVLLASEGIQAIMNGSAYTGQYFLMFRAISESLPSDVICDLTIFNAGCKQTLSTFTKRCPHLRELFLRGLLRMLEHGLLQKERQRWVDGHPVCTQKTEFIHVQLEAVSVAIGVFSFCVLLSMVIFFMEIFLRKKAGLIGCGVIRREYLHPS